MKRIYISDCEGPISKNDNAFELAASFIPDGDKLFSNISKYDDILADVLHKPGYTAGSTLKLVLPFFKAYDITDKQMKDFSKRNIVLIANSKNVLHHLQAVANVFIVSTSYEHYIKALCKALDFPYKNTYCTKISLNKYSITQKEKEQLKQIANEISQMRLVDIPQAAKSIDDFSNSEQAIVQCLDEIFWSEIPQMRVGKVLTDVVTVGGEQKAEAVRDAVKRSGAKLEDVMYVGDSITDVEAFKLVRTNGGLTVSFNGNGYAVKNAEVAVLSENNIVTGVIADLFCRFGKEKTISILRSWGFEALAKSDVGNVSPKAKLVTAKNMKTLVKESSEFRKKVRGIAIGRLG